MLVQLSSSSFQGVPFLAGKLHYCTHHTRGAGQTRAASLLQQYARDAASVWQCFSLDELQYPPTRITGMEHQGRRESVRRFACCTSSWLLQYTFCGCDRRERERRSFRTVVPYCDIGWRLFELCRMPYLSVVKSRVCVSYWLYMCT